MGKKIAVRERDTTMDEYHRFAGQLRGQLWQRDRDAAREQKQRERDAAQYEVYAQAFDTTGADDARR